MSSVVLPTTISNELPNYTFYEKAADWWGRAVSHLSPCLEQTDEEAGLVSSSEKAAFTEKLFVCALGTLVVTMNLLSMFKFQSIKDQCDEAILNKNRFEVCTKLNGAAASVALSVILLGIFCWWHLKCTFNRRVDMTLPSSSDERPSLE